MTERADGPGPAEGSSPGSDPDGDTASPDTSDGGASPPTESRGRRRRAVREERLSGKKPGGEFRVPAWVVIPLAAGAGFFVSGWLGAVFGLVAGLFLWWSRR